MKTVGNRTRRGFSLVELLAVVLVLAVLAAVAVPLYTSQRRSAAGRACRANITAISASLSGFALRNNAYPAALANLVGTAEGLSEVPRCPLGVDYTYTVNAGGSCSITCPNNLPAAATTHNGFGGTGGVNTATAPTGDWGKLLAAPAADSLP